MLPPDFTHLHVHSHFTLLGGVASVEALVARAKADGFTRLALTDTNALYGAVAFSKACATADIAPILGMVVRVAIEANGDSAPDELLLLARNRDGYRSLCRLASVIQGDSQRESLARTGIAWSAVAAHRDGLCCLAGGHGSWLHRLLHAGRTADARDQIERLARAFGAEAFVALPPHASADSAVARTLRELAATVGVPVAAVQPIYCLEPAERRLLHLLAAVERNCRLDAVLSADLPGGGDSAIDLHWPTPAAMAAHYADFPEALATAAAIARSCEPCLPDGRPVWPVLPLPADQSPAAVLSEQASAGLTARYGENPVVAAAWRANSRPSPGAALHRCFCLWPISSALPARRLSP